MIPANPHIQKIVAEISQDRLRAHLRKIEGCRHGWKDYQALEERALFIAATLRSFDLDIESQEFQFHKRTYRNIIATHYGRNEKTDTVLLGAHYDAAVGSPGADDNGSGVAVMLEAAHILSEYRFDNTIQFVAFTLEEPQPHAIHFLIGSNHFAEEARRSGRRYSAVMILESVGYADDSEGSQMAPPLIKVPVPKAGNFLGVVANGKSKDIMNVFSETAAQYVPELPVISHKVPFSGRMVPETRFSDHASFWNQGYPALMLTDTAMFRNPHYHTHRDRFETLDFNFMAGVAKAVVSVAFRLGGYSGSG